MIALAGMDMRNSVILIDQIEHDMAAGMSEWEAVIESSVRRARPVLLTAATAILAMIPLTRSVFWGTMAVAIMGGLSVATFLTLVNLPALLRPAVPGQARGHGALPDPVDRPEEAEEETLRSPTATSVQPSANGAAALQPHPA